MERLLEVVFWRKNRDSLTLGDAQEINRQKKTWVL